MCVCVGGWMGVREGERSRKIISVITPFLSTSSTSPLQTTPASLLWSPHPRMNRGYTGRGQSTSLDSDPLQVSWLRKIEPSPPPNIDPLRALAPGVIIKKRRTLHVAFEVPNFTLSLISRWYPAKDPGAGTTAEKAYEQFS